MTLPRFASLCILSLLALSVPARSQAPASAPTFDIADVHTSPRHTAPFFYAAPMIQTRYVLHDATMVDLITTAYGLDKENVQRGPSWLEQDRYEVIAKVPAGSTKDAQKLMLRALLAPRFKLVAHTGLAPIPAYVLSLGKGKSRLTEADEAGTPNCDAKPGAAQTAYIEITCKNMTMELFAQQVHQMAGGYLTKPVVNATDLKRAWDFDLKWTGRGQLEKQGADGISIFDAVHRQLGLKLEKQRRPMPTIVIDHIEQQPLDN